MNNIKSDANGSKSKLSTPWEIPSQKDSDPDPEWKAPPVRAANETDSSARSWTMPPPPTAELEEMDSLLVAAPKAVRARSPRLRLWHLLVAIPIVTCDCEIGTKFPDGGRRFFIENQPKSGLALFHWKRRLAPFLMAAL